MGFKSHKGAELLLTLAGQQLTLASGPGAVADSRSLNNQSYFIIGTQGPLHFIFLPFKAFKHLFNQFPIKTLSA